MKDYPSVIIKPFGIDGEGEFSNAWLETMNLCLAAAFAIPNPGYQSLREGRAAMGAIILLHNIGRYQEEKLRDSAALRDAARRHE